MPTLGIVTGLSLILIVLWDTFETIVLPRGVARKLRLARLFYLSTWFAFKVSLRGVPASIRREGLLSAFGPLSLLMLFLFWALCLILGFTLVQWGLGSHVNSVASHPGFGTDLYMSGTTFFTLGLGDVTPNTPLAQTVAVG